MNIKMKLLVVGLVSGGAWGAMAVEPVLEVPTANLTEKWTTNSSGWLVKNVLDSTASCWNTSGVLVVSHPAASLQSPITEYIFGSTNASGAGFSGDYSRMESISFDVRTKDISYTPSFYFKTKNNITWYYKLTEVPLNTTPEWMKVTVPLSFSANWLSSSIDFEGDKTNICEIGIINKTSKLTGKPVQIEVDNMKVVGPWGGPFTNGVSIAWLIENGIDIDKSLLDSDQDGQNNSLEFLASTDPNNSNDLFRVEIGRNAQGVPVLKWKENNKYAKYDLLEGTDLSDTNTFKLKPGWVGMQGSGGQKECAVAGEAVTGARFYKVQINVP